MEKFWKLKVVQKAHKLVLSVYKMTDHFPDTEKFGLVSQMRRAAVSVVANIVEATKRKTKNDKQNFHRIADGSLEELKYYFVLSYDLGYANQDEGKGVMNMAREIGAMLHGLNESL